MRPGELWRERLRPLLLFPGLLALLFFVEQRILLPRAAEQQPETAVAVWERHAETHSDYAPAVTRLAQEHFEADDLEAARRGFERGLSLDPDYEPAVIGMNAVVREADGREAAIAQLAPYFRAHPECDPCAQNLAADHLALGHLDRAMEYVEPLVRERVYLLPPNYSLYDPRADRFMLAGRIYEAAGRREDAIELYRVAIRRYGRNANAHFRAGRLLLSADPEQARSHFERYRNLAPREPRGFAYLARAQLALGDRGAALATLDAGEQLLADAGGPRAEGWRRQLRSLRERARRGAQAGGDGKTDQPTEM